MGSCFCVTGQNHIGEHERPTSRHKHVRLFSQFYSYWFNLMWRRHGRNDIKLSMHWFKQKFDQYYTCTFFLLPQIVTKNIYFTKLKASRLPPKEFQFWICIVDYKTKISILHKQGINIEFQSRKPGWRVACPISNFELFVPIRTLLSYRNIMGIY